MAQGSCAYESWFSRSDSGDLWVEAQLKHFTGSVPSCAVWPEGSCPRPHLSSLAASLSITLASHQQSLGLHVGEETALVSMEVNFGPFRANDSRRVRKLLQPLPW